MSNEKPVSHGFLLSPGEAEARHAQSYAREAHQRIDALQARIEQLEHTLATHGHDSYRGEQR